MTSPLGIKRHSFVFVVAGMMMGERLVEEIEPIERIAPADPFRPLPPDRAPRKEKTSIPLTSEASAAAADGRGLVHTVTRGDTLAGIALRYSVSVEALKRANRLWTPQELHSRRTVIIPSSTPVSDETKQKHERKREIVQMMILFF